MSDDQAPDGFASRIRGLVTRTKALATFQRKDSLDEGGLRLLIAEDGDIGPIALHSPSISTEDLGITHDPDRSRTHIILGPCLSVFRLARRRLWVICGVICLFLLTLVSASVFLLKGDKSPVWDGPTAIPEYNTSLGCLNASYASESTFEIPVSSEGAHLIEVTGSIVGTLVIAQADESATQVQYEMKVMADEERTFNVIKREERPNAMSLHTIGLSAPESHPCQRFDITVRVPPTVRHLTVKTEGTTHVLFGRQSSLSLSSLDLDLQSTATDNMLLSHMGVQADTMTFAMGGGWLMGNLLLTQNMSLLQSGRSAMLVDVVPSNSPDLASVPAVLRTECGPGRSHITHRSISRAAHRPIDSVHRAQHGGQLEIDYKGTAFDGSVKVTAQSLRANGKLSGTVKKGERASHKTLWVGDAEGTDRVEVENPKGYVSLNF
ncbi:uncharacterized protein B0H18DRAFT_1209253 [Fomitopsis serialis]|uniref:uncharacterized protein n=1 Tax=Fomitopsis serialis TaxID=139415 RepID=UPI002007AE8B|nr:uncharacterized protein B0H18DRAFT_1209253 [Neoantrodia serialis]KAH9930662.1 hypothetical protein B0H18DRAFT_1209253 [Neoantrodia serialis]